MIATVFRALAIVGLGSALGLVSHQMRFGKPFSEVAAPEICEDLTQVQGPGTLSPKEAASWCAHSNAVILDVRSAEAYAAGHIADAFHLPCTPDKIADELFGRLDDSLGVLVYGDGESQPLQVAQSLVRRGYGGRVFVLQGGYAAWEANGLACSSGSCPYCEGEHP